MGMDATCHIAYGFVVDRDELPWRTKEFDDIDDWWRDRNGYKPPFDLFDDKGNYIVDPTPQSCINEYFEHQRNWDLTNPCPIGCVEGNEGEEEAIITCAEIADLFFDWDYGIQQVDTDTFKLNKKQLEAVGRVQALLDELEIEIKKPCGWYAVCDYS